MRFRSPGFIAITVIFLLAEGLLAWAIYGYSRHPGPFGYADAEPRFMHGKFAHVIGPGKSRYAPSQYLFVDVETGKLKKLHDLFTQSSMMFDRDKGKIFTLQVINDQILTCEVNGQQLCTPKCTRAPQCESIKVAIATAQKNENCRALLFVSVAFAIAYYVKFWRPSASKLPQPPRAA
jgi:hypothetical protein